MSLSAAPVITRLSAAQNHSGSLGMEVSGEAGDRGCPSSATRSRPSAVVPAVPRVPAYSPPGRT
jgi:hypothetical protein